eukprot:3274208-Ditylum_brightwellii.AAC.1
MIAKANYLSKTLHKNFKLVTSSSNKASGYTQMGGTCTALVDNVVGRHMMGGANDNGLGRWSYMCIVGKEHCKLYVITGYRPCIQSDLGSSMVNVQQNCILTMRGKPNTKAQREWDKDILSLIKQWKEEEAIIVLMVEAKKDLMRKHWENSFQLLECTTS